MAFIPVPNVAHVVCQGAVDLQMTINDLYFEISGGGITPVNLQALSDAVRDWFNGQFTVPLSNEFLAVRVIATDLTVANSFRVESAAGDVGGSANEPAPNNVAGCVKFVTALSGRSFRGRNYVPALPNSEIATNTMSNSLMFDILTAYNALVGAGTFLAGWQWVAVSRFTTIGGIPNQPRTTGIATPITSAVFVNPYVKSMRSRAVGHGK